MKPRRTSNHTDTQTDAYIVHIHTCIQNNIYVNYAIIYVTYISHNVQSHNHTYLRGRCKGYERCFTNFEIWPHGFLMLQNHTYPPSTSTQTNLRSSLSSNCAHIYL